MNACLCFNKKLTAYTRLYKEIAILGCSIGFSRATDVYTIAKLAFSAIKKKTTTFMSTNTLRAYAVGI